MEHKITIFLFGLFRNRDITERTTKWCTCYSHGFYISSTALPFTVPCTQRCCHLLITKVTDKIQESLHSNEYYQEDRTETEKYKTGGKKLGTEFVWDVSLISMTIVTNLGWMVTIIHLGTLWEKGWSRPMTHQMENKAKQTATSIS